MDIQPALVVDNCILHIAVIGILQLQRLCDILPQQFFSLRIKFQQKILLAVISFFIRHGCIQQTNHIVFLIKGQAVGGINIFCAFYGQVQRQFHRLSCLQVPAVKFLTAFLCLLIPEVGRIIQIPSSEHRITNVLFPLFDRQIHKLRHIEKALGYLLLLLFAACCQ